MSVQPKRHARSVFFLVLIALATLPGTARADNLTVDCDGGPADFSSLQAAVDSLSPAGPHTITVTGTCHENVLISGRDRLTIEAPVGQMATVISADSGFGCVFCIDRSNSILLRRLVIDAAEQPVEGVFISLSQVGIQGSTIKNARGGGCGVLALNQSNVAIGNRRVPELAVLITANDCGIANLQGQLSINGHTTVELNQGNALVTQAGITNIGGGSAVGFGPATNIFRNNAFGLAGIQQSIMRINNSNLFQNNGPYGFLLTRGSFLNFSGGLQADGTPLFSIIEGHGQFGLLVADSSASFGASDGVLHYVRNNGTGSGTIKAGIFQLRPSTLLLRNVVVENNGGPGVVSEANSYVSVLSARISGNAGDGIRLQHQSVGEFGGITSDGNSVPADTMISGNGGAAVSCDNTSIVFGDTANISPLQCGQVDRRPQAPRGLSVADMESSLQERLNRRRGPPEN